MIGGEVMKHVGDMEHGSSGASDKERVYLQAPYTQVGKYADPFILLYCRERERWTFVCDFCKSGATRIICILVSFMGVFHLITCIFLIG